MLKFKRKFRRQTVKLIHGAGLQLSLFSLLAREFSDILEQISTKHYSTTAPSTAVMDPVTFYQHV
jgi:hypothetical protein